MSRVTRAADHLSVDELDQRIKQATHHWHRLAGQVILTAFKDPRPAALLACHWHGSKGFVHKVIARSNRDGPDAITPPPSYTPHHQYCSAAEECPVLEPFCDRARCGDLSTAHEIQQAYEAHLGHAVAESTISRVLKRHQWRTVRPRPHHPRSDPEEQAAWCASFEAQVAAAVATRAPDATRPVIVMAQDEGRFGRISRPQHCWVSQGIRPRVPPQIVREDGDVSSAVAPSLGRMPALILPRTTTAMMNLLLAHGAEEFADYVMVMQVEQAAWHRANPLRIPEHMRLICSPARSPDLNPVEHIWDYLRKHAMRNTLFHSLDTVTTALVTGLHTLAADAAALTSMTFFRTGEWYDKTKVGISQ